MTLLVAVVCLLGVLQYQTTLRQHNDILRIAIRRAEQSESEATAQRDEAERRAKVIRRQMAVNRVSPAQRDWVSRDFEMALRQLDAAADILGETGERNFAWSFVRRSIRDRLEVFQAHQFGQTPLAVSPDGCTIASGDEQSAIWLWNLRSGNSWRLSEAQPHGLQHLEFSPRRSRTGLDVHGDGRDLPLGRSSRAAAGKAGNDHHGGLQRA